MADTKFLEIWLELGDAPPARLDKALAAVVPEGLALSRSRLVALIKSGALQHENGSVINDPSSKSVANSRYLLEVPEAEEIDTLPQDIPLDIVFEDDALIVVNKAAGMVVHPAPGARDGTLVNALLHLCGDSLSGIGGVKRPGIVHRIDKDTSGLLVVAKTDAAHHGLARQFAKHSIQRIYDAIVWGQPSASDPRLGGMGAVKFEDQGTIKVTAPIARHRHDRKKMAVAEGGRHAVTRIALEKNLGAIASHVSCRLETGRTHQIRVHLTHIGHPLIGDPVYGRARTIPASSSDALKSAISSFKRQALHARSLGFVHPVSGKFIEFETPMPDEMMGVLTAF